MKKLYLLLAVIVLHNLTASAVKPSFVGCKYVCDDSINSFSISFVTEDTCVVEQMCRRPSRFAPSVASDTIRYSIDIKRYVNEKYIQFKLYNLKPSRRYVEYGPCYIPWISRDGELSNIFLRHAEKDTGFVAIDSSIVIKCDNREIITVELWYHPQKDTNTIGIFDLWNVGTRERIVDLNVMNKPYDQIYCKLKSGTPKLPRCVPLKGGLSEHTKHWANIYEGGIYHQVVGCQSLIKDSLIDHIFIYNDSNKQERLSFDVNTCLYSKWCDSVCIMTEKYDYEIISGMLVIWKDGETKEEILCYNKGCLLYNKIRYYAETNRYKEWRIHNQIIKVFIDQNHRNISNNELKLQFKEMYVPVNY